MELTINGNTYKLKYSFRALMAYESITGQSFAPKNLSDVLIFMYSCLLGSSKDFSLSFDDFMDFIDDNPQEVENFSDWLTGQFTKTNVLNPNKEEDTKKNQNSTEQA